MLSNKNYDDDPDMKDLTTRLMKLVPSQTQDIVATAVFLIGMPIGFLIHIFWILPTWYPAFGEAWMIRVVTMAVIGVNGYLHWLYMFRTGPNGKRTMLPNVVKPGFRYCHACHMNAPPRAYHCPVCDECAFRRDHHCSFGGVCVGHFNQRYFIGAIVNLWVVLAALVVFSWDFLWLRMDNGSGFSLARSWQIILPHLALVARVISFHQFVVVVFYGANLAALLFLTYLIVAQAFCIWKGQTRVEYLLDVHAYQLSLLENLRQCLGTRWAVAVLSPFIPSPLPSDGMSYVTREVTGHHSLAKDM